MTEGALTHEALFWMLSGLGAGLMAFLGLWGWAWLDNRQSHDRIAAKINDLRHGVSVEHKSLMEKMHNIHADILKSLNTKQDR